MRRFDPDERLDRAPVTCRCCSGFPGRTLCDADEIVCVLVCDVCEPSVRQRFGPDNFAYQDGWTTEHAHSS